MDDRRYRQIVVIDDHPVVAAGLPQLTHLEVIAKFHCVEDFLRHPFDEPTVILLDLQLSDDVQPGEPHQLMGTAAIRSILDAGQGPIIIYTSIAEDMLLAACLAAGAVGAVMKSSPGAALAEAVKSAADGNLWVDPAIAGALTRYARHQHAGALSPQQANALRYRAQGLKQQAIAARIGVSDPEIVNKYLKAAVEKLAISGSEVGDTDRHPGAIFDELARRSGLTKLVRLRDLQSNRVRRREQGK